MTKLYVLMRRCFSESDRAYRIVNLFGFLLLVMLLSFGCAHYPINPPLKQYDPDSGYRFRNMAAEKSSSLLMILTFSGGGTRAAAFSYGVLEELARTEIVLEGRKERLLDEIDAISSVSGGSFTAGYYGLFGDRIFDDFEEKFLKKNIQGKLVWRLINPLNWFRLWSPYFDRSDLAAEYYDTHVFEGGTFGDILARKGTLVSLNATDMTYGIWVNFVQNAFDVICSDVSRVHVARAAAASSAVPFVFSPITLKNYAGSCEYRKAEWITEALQERAVSTRRYNLAAHISPFLDAKKKPYVHLVDGGISDNLGLRVVLDRVVQMEDLWNSLKDLNRGNTNKFVFIVVNAETAPDTSIDQKESPPTGRDALSAATSVQISRYNFETIELLRSNFPKWAKEIKTDRCREARRSKRPEATRCDDIAFYLVEVNFKELADREERGYFMNLPTTFKLSDEEVDKLREAAGRIMRKSPEFQRLRRDLQ